jgi:hypothetical protein
MADLEAPDIANVVLSLYGCIMRGRSSLKYVQWRQAGPGRKWECGLILQSNPYHYILPGCIDIKKVSGVLVVHSKAIHWGIHHPKFLRNLQNCFWATELNFTIYDELWSWVLSNHSQPYIIWHNNNGNHVLMMYGCSKNDIINIWYMKSIKLCRKSSEW